MQPARSGKKQIRRRNPATPQEPKPGAWMAPEEFAQVVRLTPLVAIDLIVKAPDGRALVGQRKFEPAKGFFFVPGGRISKNETRAAAMRRLTREELGFELSLDQAVLLGAFDHIYPTNRFERKGFGTHYVTLGYEIDLAAMPDSLPTDQHHEYRWLTPRQILKSPDVHENTKAYFRLRPRR